MDAETVARSRATLPGRGSSDANDAFFALAHVLAELFKRPIGKELATYFGMLNCDKDDDMFMQNPRCQQGAVVMKAFFSKGNLSARIGEARDDYHKLFVGPAKLLAAPWSSVYLDLGSLFGPTTLAVERTFKRCGMQNPEGNREPCDHFAYELEFLAEMHKRTASALREGNAKDAGKSLEEAMSFKETYMNPWSNTFLDTVIAGARCDAYCGTALLARGFLEIEGAFLNCETLDRGGA